MRSVLLLAALCAAVPCASAAVEVTCADKAAAGFQEPCVVPYTFTPGASVPVGTGTVQLPTAWLGAAPVCYTQYLQNQLATPTFMPRNSTCSAYANRGCCSSETVRSIDNLDYLKNSVYPGYSIYRCGPISTACTTFFQREACFYECDQNLGKYRRYNTNACIDANDGSQNGWEIINMPLMASMVNEWWTACSNDLFCTGAKDNFFALPTLPANACIPPPAGSPAGTETATCQKFSTMYTNATDMINRLWSGSFSVAAPGSGGYVFPKPGDTPFDGIGQVNPNNNATTAPNPPFCDFRPTVSGWIQAMNDFKLYIANMMTYANVPFTGSLYNGIITLDSASWWTPLPAAPAAPAAACTSAAPALRLASVVGVAAMAALVMA